ncbi:cytochrome c oxidase subunit II [Ilumatobacter sp.]|uniref:cytochrome c oxidase subunit II n=1 Tax=Ilumatobacter sp. TaxID=1967498 RepID=UPI003B5187F9
MILGTAPASPLPPPLSEQAETVDDVWALFLWIAVGVTLLVVGLLTYQVVRFRRRSDEMPTQKHYNIPMEITYIVIPFLVVVALLVVTFVTEEEIGASEREVDLVVEVVAFQWQWQFTYPESGTTIIGGAGSDIPTLVLPAGSTVRFEMTSLDVIHSFWITAFRFKRDIIPGRDTSFEVDVAADSVGEYPNIGVCAEYCGLDHATMQFSVSVLSPEDFRAWSRQGATAAGSGAAEPIATAPAGGAP